MADIEINPYDDIKTAQTPIDPAALRLAVGQLLKRPVKQTTYTITQLQGGTLGDVRLITGEAKTQNGHSLPFRIVQKTQKQWDRPGDPHSWRREYDLHGEVLHDLCTDAFRCPQVYHARITDRENCLWMEYIQGRSGAALTLPDLTLTAEALGCFQGRCHAQADTLRRISCLTDAAYMQRDFAQWTPNTIEYQTLRSEKCALPAPLQQLLIGTQEQTDTIFQALNRLPQVLCHRDYWSENIFVNEGHITVIDWDCAGWGFPGEDIASLIADETPAGQIGTYYKTLLPAYYTALAEHMALPPMDALPIREMILFKFGYRLLQQVMFSKTQKQKNEAILALEQIAALPPMQ